MKNRITHLLHEWNPQAPPADPGAAPDSARPTAPYPLPCGINMLMPVELCIHRDVLITLLSASIQEMHRHTHGSAASSSDQGRAELEAALQQQLAFRTWARQHPGTYICIALYPTTKADTTRDLEDLEEF